MEPISTLRLAKAGSITSATASLRTTTSILNPNNRILGRGLVSAFDGALNRSMQHLILNGKMVCMLILLILTEEGQPQQEPSRLFFPPAS